MDLDTGKIFFLSQILICYVTDVLFKDFFFFLHSSNHTKQKNMHSVLQTDNPYISIFTSFGLLDKKRIYN